MTGQLPDFHSRFQNFEKIVNDERQHNLAKYTPQQEKKGFSSLFGIFGSRTVAKVYFDKQGNALDVGFFGRVFRKLKGQECLTRKELIRNGMKSLVAEYEKWYGEAIKKITAAVLENDTQAIGTLLREIAVQEDDLLIIQTTARNLFSAQKPAKGEAKKELSEKKKTLEGDLQNNSAGMLEKVRQFRTIGDQIRSWEEIKSGLLSKNEGQIADAIRQSQGFVERPEFKKLPKELQEFYLKSSPVLSFEAAMGLEFAKVQQACIANGKDEEVVDRLQSYHKRLELFSEDQTIPLDIRQSLVQKYTQSYSEGLQLFLNSKIAAYNSHIYKIEELTHLVGSAASLEQLEAKVQEANEALGKIPLVKLSQTDRENLHVEGAEVFFEAHAETRQQREKTLAERRAQLATVLQTRSEKLQEKALQKDAEVKASGQELQKVENETTAPKDTTTDAFVQLAKLLEKLGPIAEYPILGKTKEAFDKALKAYTILMDVAFNKRELSEAIEALNALNVFSMEVTRAILPELSMATYTTKVPERIQELNARKIFDLLNRDEVLGVLKRGLEALRDDFQQERRHLEKMAKGGDLLDELKVRLQTKEGDSASIDTQTNFAGRLYMESLGKNEQQEIIRYFSTPERSHFLSKDTQPTVVWSKLTVKDFDELVAFLVPEQFLFGPSAEKKQAFRIGTQYQSYSDLKGMIAKKEVLPRDISLLRKCIDQVSNSTQGSVVKFLEETKGTFLPEEWDELVREKEKSSWSEAIQALNKRYGAMLRNEAFQAQSKQITKLLAKLDAIARGRRGEARNTAQVNATLDAVEFLSKEMSWRPDVKAREAATRKRILDRDRDIKRFSPFEQVLQEIAAYSQAHISYESTAIEFEAQKEKNRRLLEEKASLDAQVKKMGEISTVLQGLITVG